jgi:hypothetical protein
MGAKMDSVSAKSASQTTIHSWPLLFSLQLSCSFEFPLVALLEKEVLTDILVDAVWALLYSSDGANSRIKMGMRSGVTTMLV